jgi:hypothetical protein
VKIAKIWLTKCIAHRRGARQGVGRIFRFSERVAGAPRAV